MIATADFRRAIEQLAEYETNPITRFRIRRALRNDRLMNRWRHRVSGMVILPVENGEPVAFDFQQLLDWLMENWDSILAILIQILPLFL